MSDLIIEKMEKELLELLKMRSQMQQEDMPLFGALTFINKQIEKRLEQLEKEKARVL